MADVTQVTVPDIGDFTDVPVIEVQVEPGQAVEENDPLVTLESDKATMDVPAPANGVVGDVLLKVGDTASEGPPVITLNAVAEAAAPAESAAPSAVRSAVSAEASARPQPEDDAPPA